MTLQSQLNNESLKKLTLVSAKIAQAESFEANQMRWQPIKTAPKEITRILAWDGQRIDVIEWGENWCSHGCYIPTHWMPLPPAPEKINNN